MDEERWMAIGAKRRLSKSGVPTSFFKLPEERRTAFVSVKRQGIDAEKA
jgi:hypothetical protein